MQTTCDSCASRVPILDCFDDTRTGERLCPECRPLNQNSWFSEFDDDEPLSEACWSADEEDVEVTLESDWERPSIYETEEDDFEDSEEEEFV